MAAIIPQNNRGSPVTVGAQNRAAQASKARAPEAFGHLNTDSIQHPGYVFNNPYRGAGSVPLSTHRAIVGAAAMNTGVAHTIIGPTGPNSQPTARRAKAVIKPRNTLPPVATKPNKTVNRAKPGFFANPTAKVRGT
jgi:hypothetical protein